MSLFGFLGSAAGKAAAETVKGTAEAVVGLAHGIRGAITGELPPDARARLEELALRADTLATQAQNDVNKIEAASSKLFVAGWRPYIGWTCGTGIGYHFIARDLLAWILRIFAPEVEAPPGLDIGALLALVTTMLGAAYLRTREKEKGVQDQH